MLIDSNSIVPDANIIHCDGVFLRKHGNNIFVMNFADDERDIVIDKKHINIITGETVYGKITLPVCGYLVIAVFY